MTGGAHQQLACLMLTTALIPIADGSVVLRAGGPKTIAYGVHWATAALMFATAILLIVWPCDREAQRFWPESTPSVTAVVAIRT